jgi:hypothetical protein
MTPRINIRTVLWIVTTLAILAAWWADRRTLEARHRAAISKANARTSALEADVHAARLEAFKKEIALRAEAEMAVQAELRRQKKTP